MIRKSLAHWNEIRDAYLVELMCGIKDLPQELVDRFEQTGDILYFDEICDKIRASLKLASPS